MDSVTAPGPGVPAAELVGPHTSSGPVRPRRFIPMFVRQAVFKRDGSECVQCRSRHTLGLAYLLKPELGGRGTVDNLRVLCADCADRTTALPPTSVPH
jgi:5-methylcytosine-specific restriction endonuclease McrA